jgi:hypothetical protein
MRHVARKLDLEIPVLSPGEIDMKGTDLFQVKFLDRCEKKRLLPLLDRIVLRWLDKDICQAAAMAGWVEHVQGKKRNKMYLVLAFGVLKA